jgi:hypothetical protein
MRDVLILFSFICLSPSSGLHGREASVPSLPSRCWSNINYASSIVVARAPNLRATERFIAGLCTLFMNPPRVLRSAIVLKPSTLLHLHHVLAKRKFRILFSLKRRRPPGPKGPNKELIEAVVALKGAISTGVVPASHNRSPWLSALPSTTCSP